MNTLQRTLIFSAASLAFTIPLNAADEQAKDSAASVSASGQWRASNVIGSSVKNSANDEIGEIEDLLIDPKTGTVTAVIVSTGGFLGLGDSLSSIPTSAFRYDVESKSFRVALSKDELAKGEQLKAADWSAGAGAKLKEARNAIGGDVSKVDNTARNERDMDAKTVTPTDQGESDADIKTTKDIRSAVIGTDLSFNAKNIKIITKDGSVVLRGVVNSAEEHDAILKIAKSHADAAKISDLLEIKK